MLKFLNLTASFAIASLAIASLATASVDVNRPPKNYMYNWSGCDACAQPESTYYDPESKMLFISNINGAPVQKDGKGSIQMLQSNGKMVHSKWVTGLNAPKGLRAHKGVLWVADIDQILSIDIKTSKITRRLKVPGAKFLNDVAIDSIGTVYVSDMLDDKIYQVVNSTVGTFAEGPQLEAPNGLLVQDQKLIVASWGKPEANFTTKIPGRLMKIDLKTKAIEYITQRPLGNLDGLEIDGKGNYLVSDWMAGKVFSVTPSGKVQELFKGMKGAADIGFILETQTIIIPRMNENKITAFDMSKYPGYKN